MREKLSLSWAMAKKENMEAPEFLVDLLNARSPSGYEQEAQDVLEKHVKPFAQDYKKDAMGSRIATINKKGDPIVMLAGHIDELGLQVKHVDDKGFIYFNTIGGHDRIMIPGRRVQILTSNGVVKGVTGKRAIHLMTPEERKKVPELHELWIDIGAKSKEDALKRIEIGDPVVYDQSFELIHEGIGVARAFDDKTGAYVCCEVLRRLSKLKSLVASVVAVATTQEEIGTRGAVTTAYNVKPHIGIAVDVGHATDHPDCDARKHGLSTLGGGPIIYRGANINPWVYDRLVKVAKTEEIPHQLFSEAGPTGTDARSIQLSREGVATGLIGIPLRYMHTPSEVADLNDIENCVKLLCAFIRSLKKGNHGIW